MRITMNQRQGALLALCSLLLPFSASAEHLCAYGIFSQTETNIRDRVQITPGAVGANTRVEVGVEAQLNGDIVSAGKVFLRDRCTVNANVWAGGTITTQNQVTVTGTSQGNLDIDPESIATKTVPVGTQHITLNNGQSMALTPGTYGNVRLNAGASMSFVEGVYNFRSFVVEAGNAVLHFDPDGGFIELNTQNELRFGDRNSFVLAGDADPVQVQWYTNATSQVKVGTDTTFNGVITAPNAQVYVFSRCTVNGALYGNSVWVDTDSKINLYPNCTAYNSDIDDSAQVAMCNALSFEELDWIPVGGEGTSEVALSDMDVSDGDTSLRVNLYTDAYVDLESGALISLPFSEGAQTVTARLDVFSPNAVPYAQWGGEIALFLMAQDGDVFSYAGSMIYDPADPDTESFSTLEVALSPEHAALLIHGAAYAMLSVSAMNDHAVFYLDRLRFCDENGACNVGCPSLRTNESDSALPPIQILWDDEDSDHSANRSSLSVYFHNRSQTNYTGRAIVSLTTGLNNSARIDLGNISIAAGQTIAKTVSASALPFCAPGVVVIANISFFTAIEAFYATTRHYLFNSGCQTFSTFSAEYFDEVLDGYLYQMPEEEKNDPQHPTVFVSAVRFGSFEFNDEDFAPSTDPEDTDIITID